MVTVSPSGNTTAAVTYTPIETQTLSSAAASVTFSSIPGTYKDLICVYTAGTATPIDMSVRMNSDSGSNYSFTWLSGTASSAVSNRDSNYARLLIDNYAYPPSAALTYNVNIIQFMNYSNTTTYKTTLMRNGNAAAGVDAGVGLWRSTSAITSLVFNFSSGANIAAGSVFTLYGIGA